MNIREIIRQILIDKEGWRNIAYKDTEDYWHIAVGHSLKDAQTDRELEILDIEDDPETWQGFEVTDEQVEALLQHDMDETFHRLSISFTDAELEALDRKRFLALYNMAYQIGSVSGFPSMVKAVKEEDWDRAADEMLYRNGLKKEVRSLWYKQTPKRCQDMADLMRYGSVPDPVEEDPVTEIAASLKQSDLKNYSDSELITELYNRHGDGA